MLTKHKARRFVVDEGEKVLIAEHAGPDVRIPFDQVLVAVGRIANTEGYGLEELGIGTTRQRTVETDAYLQTIYPNIYACGDVAGPYQFTHTASHQAWYAAVNALFGRFRQLQGRLPRDSVGDVHRSGSRSRRTQRDRRRGNRASPVTATVYGIDDLDRAIADEEAHGLVKVLTQPGCDRILGVTIVGEHAGDLIAEYVLAMKHGLGLNKILGTIHIYPTLAEANKYAAGALEARHGHAGAVDLPDRIPGLAARSIGRGPSTRSARCRRERQASGILDIGALSMTPCRPKRI